MVPVVECSTCYPAMIPVTVFVLLPPAIVQIIPMAYSDGNRLLAEMRKGHTPEAFHQLLDLLKGEAHSR